MKLCNLFGYVWGNAQGHGHLYKNSHEVEPRQPMALHVVKTDDFKFFNIPMVLDHKHKSNGNFSK